MKNKPKAGLLIEEKNGKKEYKLLTQDAFLWLHICGKEFCDEWFDMVDLHKTSKIDEVDIIGTITHEVS